VKGTAEAEGGRIAALSLDIKKRIKGKGGWKGGEYTT